MHPSAHELPHMEVKEQHSWVDSFLSLWVLGTELRLSGLYGKCFTRWVMAPAQKQILNSLHSEIVPKNNMSWNQQQLKSCIQPTIFLAFLDCCLCLLGLREAVATDKSSHPVKMWELNDTKAPEVNGKQSLGWISSRMSAFPSSTMLQCGHLEAKSPRQSQTLLIFFKIVFLARKI